jgi:hypothetical protein
LAEFTGERDLDIDLMLFSHAANYYYLNYYAQSAGGKSRGIGLADLRIMK